jgi:hypothetical protein
MRPNPNIIPDDHFMLILSTLQSHRYIDTIRLVATSADVTVGRYQHVLTYSHVTPSGDTAIAAYSCKVSNLHIPVDNI